MEAGAKTSTAVMLWNRKGSRSEGVAVVMSVRAEDGMVASAETGGVMPRCVQPDFAMLMSRSSSFS